MFKFKNSLEIFSYYCQSFNEISDIINALLNNLFAYMNSLPYYVKCICKIISIFIEKKYPNSNKIERNSYIAKFFFNNLLFLVFDNPTLNCLINEHLITEKTKNRLMIVKIVLEKFISGDLFYENDNYVPFNSFFIEKMPKLIEFFDLINNVKLPCFIDKLLNDKLSEDYSYDYFKENPEENIFYRNICFNLDILYSLIINAEKSKDKIFLTDKSLEKLISNKKKLENLRNKKEGIDDENIITFFFISDIINNKKYD